MARIGYAIFAAFLLAIFGFGIRSALNQRKAVAKTYEWVEQLGKQVEGPFIRMSNGKNLAIAFKGFDWRNERHVITVQAICEKGRDAIKPATLFYSDVLMRNDGMIGVRPQLNGMDILKSQFNPSPFWAMDRKCAGIVTITANGDQFGLSFDPVHMPTSLPMLVE